MLGIVLVFLASTAHAEHRCKAGYEAAVAQLRTADTAAAKNDYIAANRALDGALNILGDGYAPPGVWDHTDMHLLAAWDRERNGHLVDAAKTRRRILLQRVHMCRDPAPPRQ